MIKHEISKEDLDTIFIEMFRRVNLSEQDYRSFNMQEDHWYTKYEWSEEEEQDFQKWLANFLYEHKYALKRKHRGVSMCEQRASIFLLNYGWKTTYGKS